MNNEIHDYGQCGTAQMVGVHLETLCVPRHVDIVHCFPDSVHMRNAAHHRSLLCELWSFVFPKPFLSMGYVIFDLHAADLRISPEVQSRLVTLWERIHESFSRCKAKMPLWTPYLKLNAKFRELLRHCLRFFGLNFVPLVRNGWTFVIVAEEIVVWSLEKRVYFGGLFNQFASHAEVEQLCQLPVLRHGFSHSNAGLPPRTVGDLLTSAAKDFIKLLLPRVDPAPALIAHRQLAPVEAVELQRLRDVGRRQKEHIKEMASTICRLENELQCFKNNNSTTTQPSGTTMVIVQKPIDMIVLDDTDADEMTAPPPAKIARTETPSEAAMRQMFTAVASNTLQQKK